MFENEIALNQFNRRYLGRLVEEMTEDNLDHGPAPGLHSPRWILSHLAIVGDMGLKLIGQSTRLPHEWHAAYGPTSQAGSHDRVRPSFEALMVAITDGYGALCDGARGMTAEWAQTPHGIERLKWSGLLTRGEMLAHLLATHFAVHLGQLSTLRRLQGKPMLF